MTTIHNRLIEQVEHCADEFNALDTDNFEEVLDYLEEALSMETVRDSRNRVTGMFMLVAFGDPNIEVDTRNCTVKGWWGYYSCEVKLDPEKCEGFNSQVSELDISF